MRSTGITLAAVAIMLGVVGCGTAPDTPPGSSEPRELTAAERDLLDEAEQTLTYRCMRQAGFEMYDAAPPEPAADLPFGNDDVSYARANGLGLGEVDLEQYRNQHPNMRYLKSLTPKRRDAYGTALNGEPGTDDVTVKLASGFAIRQSPDGCTAKAQTDLYGSFERWFRVRTQIENLPSQFMSNVFADRAYRLALANWSRCMARHGKRAEDPAALRERFTRLNQQDVVGGSRPSAAEIAAAVTEAGCARKSGLVRIGNDLQRRYSKQTWAAHRELVLDYQEMSVAALAKANEIAGG